MPLIDYFKRIWIWHFETDRILDSFKSRKGKCNQCGKCCTFFGIKCLFLNKENKCIIYRFRPNLLCKIPPLNIFKGEREKHKNLKCGYYWNKR